MLMAYYKMFEVLHDQQHGLLYDPLYYYETIVLEVGIHLRERSIYTMHVFGIGRYLKQRLQQI